MATMSRRPPLPRGVPGYREPQRDSRVSPSPAEPTPPLISLSPRTRAQAANDQRGEIVIDGSLKLFAEAVIAELRAAVSRRLGRGQRV